MTGLNIYKKSLDESLDKLIEELLQNNTVMDKKNNSKIQKNKSLSTSNKVITKLEKNPNKLRTSDKIFVIPTKNPNKLSTSDKMFVIPTKKQIKMNTKYNDEISHEFFIVDDIVYFALDGRAKKQKIFAMISANKWQYVSRYNWYLGKAGYPLCYKLGKLPLHRFIFTYILGEFPPSNLYVDHIDRNKLNNTDGNLRLVTPQENSFNKSTQSNKKGVKKVSDGNFTGTIIKNGKRHEIKNIPSEKQAAEIYNIMAEELFGCFAAFNKIE